MKEFAMITASTKYRSIRPALAMQLLGATMLALLGTACGNGSGESESTVSDEQSLRATIGAEGGELVGKPGTAFDGVHLTIPAGALAQATEIEITQAKNLNPLPPSA